jgi:hypothetical protein
MTHPTAMGATSGGIRMNKLGCTLLSFLGVALVLGADTAKAQDYATPVRGWAICPN